MNNLESRFVEKFENIDFHFCNTNWWPLIRVQVAYQLHLMQIKNESYFLLTKEVESSINNLTLRDCLSIIKSRLSSQIVKSDIAVFTNEANRTTLFNGNYINQFTTPFIEYFEELAIPYELFEINAFSDTRLKSDKNKRLYKLIVLKEFHQNKQLQLQLSDISQYLQTETGWSYDFYNYLSNQVIECATSYLFFKWYLKRLRYKSILSYCYYNNSTMALFKAANELEIPTIEYQHSQVTSNHFAYSNWGDSITNSGTLFPSQIWVWRDSDVLFLKKEFSALPNIQIIKGGNIFLSRFKESVKENDNTSLKILISLQGVGLPQYITDYIANSEDVIWYLRLHPRYPLDGELIEQLKKKNPAFVETDDANKKSIYELLGCVDYHLTNFSGSAVEAQSFNVTNIIYGEKGFIAYREQIENKVYLFINNEHELNDILTNRKKGNVEFDKVLTDNKLVKENIKSIFGK